MMQISDTVSEVVTLLNPRTFCLPYDQFAAQFIQHRNTGVQMRVLLISPLPELDPACGDVTYTEMLLAHPPGSVRYDTYDQALRSGTLIEHGRLSSILNGSNRIFEFFLWLFLKIVNFGRSSRMLLWEPFRFYSVVPNSYDLVHIHALSVRFFKLDCPVVLSNSISHHYLYRDARKVFRTQLVFMESMERFLCAATKMIHPSYRVHEVTRIIAFTEFMYDWYLSNKLVTADKIEIVPAYLPVVAQVRKHFSAPLKIGFAAIDFEAKGGLVLLESFKQVRKKYPDCQLHIVGSAPRLSEGELKQSNVVWQRYVERKILTEIIQSFDVFAYPTNFDGLPIILLEVMSLGVPIVSSDYPPMLELLANGEAGLLAGVGDAQELSEKICIMLDEKLNLRFAAAARDRFDSHYSSEIVRPKLMAAYEKARLESLVAQ